MSSINLKTNTENDAKALSAIYIVSDPTRMQIMQVLSMHGSLCAHEILSFFDISQPTLSHHMNMLAENGLVHSEKDGRRVKYSIAEEGINNIIQLFEKMIECTYAIENPTSQTDQPQKILTGMKKTPMLPKPKKAIQKPEIPKDNVIKKTKSKSKNKSKNEDKKKESKKGKGKKGKKK